MGDKPDTKTDRIVRGFLDHPFYAWLIVASLALAGLGQAAGGLTALKDLFKRTPPLQSAVSPQIQDSSAAVTRESQTPNQSLSRGTDGDVRLVMPQIGGDSFTYEFPMTISNTDSRTFFINSFSFLMKLPVQSLDPDTPYSFCDITKVLLEAPRVPVAVKGGSIIPFRIVIREKLPRCEDEDPKEFEAEGIKVTLPEGNEFYVQINAVDWNGRTVESLTKLGRITRDGISTYPENLTSLLLETKPKIMNFRNLQTEQ